MIKKPQTKTWIEIEMAIAAIAITATIGFWNLFARPDLAASAQADEPAPTEEVAVAVAQVPQRTLIPGLKIILGGASPQVQQVQVVSSAPSQGAPSPSRPKKKGNTGSSK
jgi:hypothetical protein